LQAHRVLAGAIKGLYPQAVLEPAKEQLDLPALAVGVGDDYRRYIPEIGPQDQPTGVRGIVEGDAPQITGPILRHIRAVESHNLVGAKQPATIDGAGDSHVKANVGPGADDKKRTLIGKAAQPAKINISTIHDIDRPRLDRQMIQTADVARLARGHVDESRHRAAQIECGVQLECGLRAREVGPRA